MRRFTIFLLTIFLISSINNAQKKKLTYNQAFEYGMPRILQSLPSIKGWFDDQNYLEFRYTQGSPAALFKVNAETGEASVHLDYSAINENLKGGLRAEKNDGVTDDQQLVVFNESNDLYLYFAEAGELINITNDSDEEKNPTLSPDGNYLAYTKNADLYVYDITQRKENRLTTDGSNVVYNGYASWVYYEEILERSSRYKAFWWSPDSRKIAFLRFDDTPVPVFPLFNCAGLHGELELQHYPKAGDPNPLVKLGVANVRDSNIEWIADEPDGENYIAFPFFSVDGDKVYYQWMNRAQDNIKIFSVDLDTKKSNVVYDETQKTWVEFFFPFYVFKNGRGFIIRSDKDGWSNLYYYDMQGNLIAKLTDNNWEVKDISYVDEKNGFIYFHGTGEISTNRHFFRVGLDGKNLKQLTKEDGTHSCEVSADGSYFIDTYSNINHPGGMKLYNIEGDLIRELGTKKSPVFENYETAVGELFTIETSDGVELPTAWYLPVDFDKSKKYPVIFSVYGGPGRSSVSNSYPRWVESFYYAQNGIIVLEVDHRGSGHFGKVGAAKMHRNLGYWEVNDLTEAVKWLHKQPFIDGSKIGIEGASYGGYVSALAITKEPEYFNFSIPELSVTDWRLYDNFYTERYMDKPSENTDGYKSSSTLSYVDNYKSGMFIIHSTLDDNVHMQNTMQLAGKLQEKEKNFEMMIYPSSRHGIGYTQRNHLKHLVMEFWWKSLLGKEFKEYPK